MCIQLGENVSFFRGLRRSSSPPVYDISWITGYRLLLLLSLTLLSMDGDSCREHSQYRRAGCSGSDGYTRYVKPVCQGFNIDFFHREMVLIVRENRRGRRVGCLGELFSELEIWNDNRREVFFFSSFLNVIESTWCLWKDFCLSIYIYSFYIY